MVNTLCFDICGEVLQLCVISTSIPQLENYVYSKSTNLRALRKLLYFENCLGLINIHEFLIWNKQMDQQCKSNILMKFIFKSLQRIKVQWLQDHLFLYLQVSVFKPFIISPNRSHVTGWHKSVPVSCSVSCSQSWKNSTKEHLSIQMLSWLPNSASYSAWEKLWNSNCLMMLHAENKLQILNIMIIYFLNCTVSIINNCSYRS